MQMIASVGVAFVVSKNHYPDTLRLAHIIGYRPRPEGISVIVLYKSIYRDSIFVSSSWWWGVRPFFLLLFSFKKIKTRDRDEHKGREMRFGRNVGNWMSQEQQEPWGVVSFSLFFRATNISSLDWREPATLFFLYIRLPIHFDSAPPNAIPIIFHLFFYRGVTVRRLMEAEGRE